jgi:hypothetical protein
MPRAYHISQNLLKFERTMSNSLKVGIMAQDKQLLQQLTWVVQPSAAGLQRVARSEEKYEYKTVEKFGGLRWSSFWR